ncbi:NmrA-like family protein [Aspergillus brunneoviolaceus CBS 621.78]|uniref:NmrA-like family protein n=1 Tax=Aspergillus brunneoviolaceus CBS 621.78 TaxID=1450534 RepID=A0ACD1FTI0_9EURO|nr:NmrA-like family protein [Aspergillus brunneoviolaceus CBS 621.78]RAH40295.1 NmrA-like family protein [Aspergillus brunneoviolaceus CBS 621.78]
MTPSILIAGATGNTGRNVVKTLSQLLATTDTLPHHRILALTRSPQSAIAQQLAQLPGVEVLEQNWVELTPSWLQEHGVDRAFLASHNQPHQFAEESSFHVAALRAGVRYVVRISTTAANVRPDCDAYYARAHWAIEDLLRAPEFHGLQWTSLQPNIFAGLWLASAAEFIQQARRTGRQGTLRLMASETAPVGIVDPEEVGALAAHLLVQADPAVHNRARYVVNGPADVSGREIVRMVGERIGAPVERVCYEDLSGLEAYLEREFMGAPQSSRNVIGSVKHALRTAWEGKCAASTTSREVLEIAAPKRTPVQVLDDLLRE